MPISRFKNEKQLGLSATPGSVMISSSANEATFLAPPVADRLLFYDLSSGLPAWLSLGPGLSFNGTVLETSAGSGFISTIMDEGVSLGAGLTTLDFVGSGFTATAAGPVATLALDADLNAIANLATLGFSTRTASNTWATRTLTGTAGRLSIANGDGVSGNPTFDIDSNVAFKNASETITATWTFSNPVVAAGVPTIGDHLVNKTYVDGLLAGVRRSSVRQATTANITLSGEQTIDGLLTSASRVLVKDQVTLSQNGIYISGAGAWTRAVDMDTAIEVDGTLVLIENGTQQGQQWYTVSDVVTLGTDPITFTKIQVGVIDGSGAQYQVATWADSDTLTGFANWIYDANGNLVVGTTTAASATTRLTLRAASSGTGLIIQNNGGSTIFRANEDGTVVVGLPNAITLANTGLSRVGVISLSPGTGNNVYLGTGNGGALVYGNQFAWTATSGTESALITSANFAPTSGTATFAAARLTPIINQTGGANGATYGLIVLPDVGTGGVNAADFRGVDITVDNAHYSLWSHSGKVRLDFGGDATGDIPFRSAAGQLDNLAIGTSQQVLIGGTTPAWGSAPVTPSECYVINVSGPTVDLNSLDGKTVDRDGVDVAFTIPTEGKKMKVYLNGQLLLSDGAGGTPSRDYSVNVATHVITFNEDLIGSDVVYIEKFS